MGGITYRDHKIELGILANGGDWHHKNWCQCDSSVGYAPCEYCAIFNALNRAREVYQLYMELKETVTVDAKSEKETHPTRE
jgi:hypothetical protein